MTIPLISKEYFRATCTLIGKLEKVDYLTFTQTNTAIVNTVFSVCNSKSPELKNFIAVSFKGEIAELFHKKAKTGQWFHIQGVLRDRTPEMTGFALPKISIKAENIKYFPAAEEPLIQVEIVGRLTGTPEKVIKAGKQDFLKGSIAVNRAELKKAEFFDFTVFNKWLIEHVNTELKKGEPVVALGSVSFYRKGEDNTPQTSIVLQKFIKISRSIT